MIRNLAHLFIYVALFSFAPAVGAAQAVPAGPVQSALVTFQIAVYYADPPMADPMTTLSTVAAKGWPKLTLTKIAAKPTGMMLHARVEKDVPKNYRVADVKMLGYFGRGLSKAQIDALQGSKQALVMDFAHPALHAMEGLRSAYGVAERVARDTGGYLWDEETREMFTPDKWREIRLAGWTQGVPDVSRHTTIHSYKNGELARAITLGMSKFGLPDLVIDQFPWSSGEPVAHTLNLVAQALAEGALIGPKGHIDVGVNMIANKQSRATIAAQLAPKAGDILARLALVAAVRDEGDPQNQLAEITFTRYAGANVQARQDSMLRELFGAPGKIKSVQHDDALENESARARKALFAMQSDFNRGLEPGEYIRVKAPFATKSGGVEWMWVELITWKGDTLSGLLKNEPFDIPALHAGQMVNVSLNDVFDYTRTYRDGRQVGNTTQAIIMKMQGELKEMPY